MEFVFGYAGVPVEFYDHIYKNHVSFARDVRFFGAPLNSKPLQYCDAYSQRFIEHFAGLVKADHHNQLSDTAFAVICIEHDRESTSAFCSSLFPSIFVASVQWEPCWAPEMAKRNSANNLIAAFAQATAKAKRALRAMGDELQSRSNATPLLLPIRNFRSRVLAGELANLHTALLSAEDCASQIRSSVERIRAAHPFQRAEAANKRVYVDDRRIIYQSPGHERHAFARPNTGHPSRCVLAGRRRFGAPYDHAFHYDCTKAGHANLRGVFFGCHEEEAARNGDPHLNIAPNDYVRP